MKKLLVSLLLVSGCVMGKTIPITLEFATTTEERLWGLMGRKDLPKDTGMLFVFPQADIQRFWAFNCFLDLSVAFLDNDGVIREIQSLKAYPVKMDPKRPVRNLGELQQYPMNDPIVKFFRIRGVQSSFKTRYVLEVPKGWFEKRGIGPGNVLLWENENPVGFLQ